RQPGRGAGPSLDPRRRGGVDARLQPDQRVDAGGSPGGTSAWVIAARASAAGRARRPLMPSFVYTFCRWLSTVRTETTSRSAIALLDSPRAASVAMSRSRGVNGETTTWASTPGVTAPSQAAASAAAR